MFLSTLPLVTTDPNKLEAQAKEHLSAKSYAYVAGGAGERATMDANRLAFRQWKLIPRMLRSSPVSLQTTLFGHTHPSPLILCPIGVQRIFYPDGECATARAAAAVRVPYTLSTAASSTIEQVADAMGDAHRWYQLYWPKTDEITISLLTRAKKAGYSVLVVTLDTPALAWRPWDLDQGYIPFVTGLGNEVGFSDPAFQRIFRAAHGKDPADDITAASLAWAQDVFSGRGHTWDDLRLLREHWSGPIVLKGIQHVDDARAAVEAGVDGIVVSNHGGRQVDGAIGSLSVLSEIVDAVGDKLTVLFDSGVRTGVDVIKALCLGAKGVLLGRPWVYGLAIGGQKGVEQVVKGLLADTEQSMGLAGIAGVDGCTRDMLRFVEYSGDRASSN
ncbi:FMN-dependent alpha-hydroxy acid dehydrogenase [Trichodelitschia bisporula]|uniref:FMN-dependent alpha-hydroxy acid dehydrogenase n=1 Tax=Trichodelitschia bisporula TaxID=703511 RepID=A0A6G1I7S0_9PEZI|nr:FMN-dependent alpha-hydroxy acid dehydrogenase [Trichodelitschia bisporula]